jgi:ABC-2 type transport system ATP-binding protein
MINRSRKVLDGKLREIRRSSSRNAVALRFEGNDGLLKDPELVMNVRQVGDDFEVLLVEGVNPQTLLKRLIESNTVVTKFELVEPTLHDIFIAKVKES